MEPMQQPYVENIKVPRFHLRGLVRIPFFRLALGDSTIWRVATYVWNRNPFNPKVAERSINRFIALGAEASFVTPRDGLGRVQMMTFKAADLETKIKDLGGKWERVKIDDHEVFAIIPPENPTDAWHELKEKLSHFRWKEENNLLITCESADLIPLDQTTQMFLFVHDTSNVFASEWKRAGFYIGAKMDLCFFDNGNTWKNEDRPIGEEAFYLEIEAVYNAIKDDYPVKNVWVGGKCGGAPVAAYIKERLHNQGINFFVESSFPDIDDFTKPIWSCMAPYLKGSLVTHHLPIMEDAPPSCQFCVAKLWRNLTRYEEETGGKFIFIEVENDELIQAPAYQRYLQLAQSINLNTTHLFWTSTAGSHHGDSFYNYASERRRFIQAVFQ